MKPMAVNRKSKCRKNEETNRGMQLEEGKPPLCKGRWLPGGQTEGLMRLNQGSWKYPLQTIPQSKIRDFCQPPLHKGALRSWRIVLTR